VPLVLRLGEPVGGRDARRLEVCDDPPEPFRPLVRILARHIPSFWPRALAAARAALVRSEISSRSFLASIAMILTAPEAATSLFGLRLHLNGT